MAWHIVRMGPLRPEIETGPEPAGDLPRRLLASLRAGGFRRFVAEWGGRLAARCPLDAFGAKRLRDLLDAAGEFDEAGGSDVDEFLRFVENYSVNDLAADSAVRVMTVHQSKGLGFDVVLLPELAGDSVAAPAPRDFVIARARGSNRPAWAMRLPRAVVCECDDTLAGEAARALAADAFEELCVLYVAMTRARRGLYAITSYPGPHSEAITPGALLKLRLADDIKPVSGAPFVADGQGFTALYEDGSFDAYPGPLAAPRRPCAVRPRIAPDFSARPSLRSPLQRVRPSAEELRVTQAGALFADERRDVLDFGTAIHELFEKVGWIEEADADAIVSEWLRSARFAEAVRRDACEQFRRAMLSPEVRLVLARPAAAVELWREKSVEVVIGSRLVSAKLDRVVVERDSSGRAVRAGLLDYKSDRVSAGAAMDRAVSTYRPQVSLYARALSLILDVPLPRVRCDLVFTRAAAVRRVRTLREPAGATRR
jgi:ATP-dependent helicase/nuclease subunit A